MKSISSLAGVLSLTKSSCVRCSRKTSFPLCIAAASWLGNPNHIWDTISILGIDSIALMLWDLLESECVACLPTSLRLRLALWLSMVITFLGLLYAVGVEAAKLMVSNLEATSWFGAAVNSSFDMDRRRELPPCSGDMSSNCISMS